MWTRSAVWRLIVVSRSHVRANARTHRHPELVEGLVTSHAESAFGAALVQRASVTQAGHASPYRSLRPPAAPGALERHDATTAGAGAASPGVGAGAGTGANPDRPTTRVAEARVLDAKNAKVPPPLGAQEQLTGREAQVVAASPSAGGARWWAWGAVAVAAAAAAVLLVRARRRS